MGPAGLAMGASRRMTRAPAIGAWVPPSMTRPVIVADDWAAGMADPGNSSATMQTPKVKMRMRPPFEILTQVIPGLAFWLSELKPVCESLLCDAPPHAALLVPDRRIE